MPDEAPILAVDPRWLEQGKAFADAKRIGFVHRRDPRRQ
jgi:hypothetical protein